MPPGATLRRTRSQAAPDWTTSELFILVKEISAVEKDCLKVLSSYQKWKMVVQNCTTLEVCRSLNQCRGKWKSLVNEYNMINQWDAKSTIGSYWDLGKEKRKDLRLPVEFDAELFRLVDSHVRSQMETDSDSDSDPDAEAQFLDAVAKLGSKRKKRKATSLVPQKRYDYESPQIYYTEENHPIAPPVEELHVVRTGDMPKISCEIENPVIIIADDEPEEIVVEQNPVNPEERPQVTRVEETPQETKCEEKPQNVSSEEKPQNVSSAEKPRDSQPQKKMGRMGKKEKEIAESLHQKADMIHAIINGTLPGLTNLSLEELSSADDFQTYIVRRQAEKLIECFGDIVNTIKQCPSLFQGGVQ